YQPAAPVHQSPDLGGPPNPSWGPPGTPYSLWRGPFPNTPTVRLSLPHPLPLCPSALHYRGAAAAGMRPGPSCPLPLVLSVCVQRRRTRDRGLMPPAPAPPWSPGARRSCPWRGTSRWPWTTRRGPARAGRWRHTGCRGHGGSGPGASACRVFGQSAGLLVGTCGELDLRRLALRGDLAEQPEGPRSRTPVSVRMGELEGLLGEPHGVIHAPGHQIGLAQPEGRGQWLGPDPLG